MQTEFALKADGDSLHSLMTKIADFERQNGLTPTIRELARSMDKRTSAVRSLISEFMGEGEIDGTSACTSSLKEILLKTAFRRLTPSFDRSVSHDVLLLDEDGSKIDVLPREVACTVAEDKKLFLFFVRPDSKPPVARLIDFGKFKFQSEKLSRASRAKHHVVDVKQLRLNCGIAARDYKIKLQSAQKFLKGGDKVSLFVVLTDRKATHVALAFELLNRTAADLHQFSVVDEEPTLDGLTVKMLLTPIR